MQGRCSQLHSSIPHTPSLFYNIILFYNPDAKLRLQYSVGSPLYLLRGTSEPWLTLSFEGEKHGQSTDERQM